MQRVPFTELLPNSKFSVEKDGSGVGQFQSQEIILTLIDTLGGPFQFKHQNLDTDSSNLTFNFVVC